MTYVISGQYDRPVDHGEFEQPHRILLISAGDRDLKDWLEEQTLTRDVYAYRRDPSAVQFEAQRLAFAQAQSEGQTFDAALQGIDAVLRLADQRGFGYVAFSLSGPEREAIAQAWAQWKPAQPELPAEAKFVVINVGGLQSPLEITFGAPQPGIHFQDRAAVKASLMQALFGQSQLFMMHRSELGPESLQIEDPRAWQPPIESQKLRQLGLNLQKIAWRPFSYAQLLQQSFAQWPKHARELPDPELQTLSEQHRWLAPPLERVETLPLANGGLLLLRQALSWNSDDGRRVHLGPSRSEAGYRLSYRAPAGVALQNPLPTSKKAAGIELPLCQGLPQTRVSALRSSPRGDALILRQPNGDLELFALQSTLPGHCRFQSTAYFPAGDSPLIMGRPHRLGLSAWISPDTQNHELRWRHRQGYARFRLTDRHFGPWDWHSSSDLFAVTLDDKSPKLDPRIEWIRNDPSAKDGQQRHTITTLHQLTVQWPQFAQGDYRPTTIRVQDIHEAQDPTLWVEWISQENGEHGEQAPPLYSIHTIPKADLQSGQTQVLDAKQAKTHGMYKLLHPQRFAPAVLEKKVFAFGASLEQSLIFESPPAPKP